jgi:phosphoribosyl 1,2-cyclic phosphodiesterase
MLLPRLYLALSLHLPGRRYNQAPLSELEAALNRVNKKPIVVFHHSPDVDDFYHNVMHEGWKKEIREKWESILNSYNVKAVITG